MTSSGPPAGTIVWLVQQYTCRHVATPYDDAKRAAVLAALLQGQSVHQVARDYAVDRATVIRWRDKAGLQRTRVPPEKVDEIGELVNDVLSNLLTTVSVLAERARDEEWFNRQDAADVAVLAGVFTDKSIRILEALESAGAESGTDVDTAPPPGAA
jgi:transposase-like protein